MESVIILNAMTLSWISDPKQLYATIDQHIPTTTSHFIEPAPFG